MKFDTGRGTAVMVCLLGVATFQAQAPTARPMPVDVAGVIGRSNIVLGRPNQASTEAMPLGNGRLGVALWAEDGITAQLNRADTLPYRYSPGQVVIPGIAAITSAMDYAGRLNLYGGTFEESGGGMTLRAYVQPDSDTLIFDVTGADPARPQTALLKLWEPRLPQAGVHGAVGLLAESWVDDKNPGATGRTFGSVAAITAEGRSVSAAETGARTLTVTVTPNADGHFRILVACPQYHEDAWPVVAKALADRNADAHAQWWQAFWHRAGVLKLTSTDGSGEYMENLRNLYLFSAAAESGGDIPGSQAGVADLFSAVRDDHQWDPSAFWHWNLRMQVAANLSANLPELNTPYFRLYRDNLRNLEQWTRERMQGAPGICIPETMRFNGKGIEYETWITQKQVSKSHEVSGWNCDSASGPYYNARTLSTGAEVSLWIWQHFLATGDKEFLAANFPVMAASARFLLAYEKPGADGLRHTGPSNAHETQWDVADPTTDLAARQALYTTTIEAAALLHAELALVSQLRLAIPKIPPLPRTSTKPPLTLLMAGADSAGDDVIATSYSPGAAIHNVENIGLEPVWPYDLIGDTSPLFALARRTYFARPNKGGIDWSFDPVQAARLGLGAEVKSTLLDITQANQRYINGFAHWGGNGKEFYVEQIAMVALALQESLVQDYDGIIRIAPAIPPGWDFDGSVAVRNGTIVDVQVRGGIATAVALEVKTAQKLQVRNPWPGEAVVVRNLRDSSLAVRATSSAVISFTGAGGASYRLERASKHEANTFVPVGGDAALAYRKLGAVQIGLAARP